MSTREKGYLGIDPSYTGCGAVLLTDTGYKAYLYDFSADRIGQGPTRLRAIFDTLRSELNSITSDYDVQHVLIEGYAPGAKFGREILGELGGVLKVALTYTIEPSRIRAVAPTALKKFTTGSGTATKDVMLLNVFKKWGVSLTDNNLGDAYAAARLAQALDTGGDHKYEQEVVTSVLNGPKKKHKDA